MLAYDPEYIAARTVLLDALEALVDHREAIVVVGAQAVYLRTEPLPGYQDFTTDGDLALDPALLRPRPGLEEAMRGAGFRLKGEQAGQPEPGIWEARAPTAGGSDGVIIPVDLIVPEAVAPRGGRRGARLGGQHGRRAARRAVGLEGALVDHSPVEISALHDEDDRRVTVEVAGAAALIVAKLHKIRDRAPQGGRLVDKDAGDLLRLFLAAGVAHATDRFVRLLDDPRSAEVTRLAIAELEPLFGTPRRLGTEMAVRALDGVVEPETIHTICSTFVAGTLSRLREMGKI
jgi:hypothetical protein